MLDSLLLGFTALLAALGLWRGAWKELASMLVWVISLMGANPLSSWLLQWLAPEPSYRELAQIGAWVAGFFVLGIVLNLGAYFLSKTFHWMGLGAIERAVGAVLGALKAYVLAALLLASAQALGWLSQSWLLQSHTAGVYLAAMGWLSPLLPPEIGGFLGGR